MPKVIRVVHKETGERRAVYAIDFASYDKDEWAEQEGDGDTAAPARPVTTTMGKPIETPRRTIGR